VSCHGVAPSWKPVSATADSGIVPGATLTTWDAALDAVPLLTVTLHHAR